MSTILPVLTISDFARNPKKALESNQPYLVIMSHKEDKGVILKPHIFKKITTLPFWQEICEEWWEGQDAETKAVVAEGKKMIKSGNYSSAVPFK